MNINRVRSISIVAKTQGVKEATGEVKELTQAQRELGQSADAMAIQTDRAAKKQAAVAKQYEAQTRRLDPTARATERVAKEMAILDRQAQQTGMAMSEQVKRADLIRQTYGPAAVEVDKMAAAMSKSTTVLTGMTKAIPTKEMDKLAAGMSAAGDVGAVASQKMVAGMSAMGKQAEVASQNVRQIAAQSAALTKQSSRNSAEMLNLGRQFADVAVSVQAGQSLLTVGLQQGAQVIDVFASSSRSAGQIFADIFKWAGRFVFSAKGVVAGIAGIGAGALFAANQWGEGQREIERALVGIGRRSGVTADDINEIGEATAKSSKMSVSESRAAALGFAKTGNIYKENITELTSLVEGFGKMIGKSSDEAAAELAKLFGGDIVAGAEKLDAITGRLDGSTIKLARDLQIQNRQQEAIAVVAAKIAPAMKEAAGATGFWGTVWNSTTNAMSNFFDSWGKSMSELTGIGERPIEQLRRLQKEFETIQSNVQKRQEARAAGFPVAADMSPGDAARLKPLLADMAALEDQAKRTGDAMKQMRMDQIGKEADAAVRAIVPEIQQLEQLEQAIQDLERAKQQLAAGGNINMGFAKEIDESLTRTKNLKSNLQASREETTRAAQVAQQLGQAWGTTSNETAKQLELGRAQIGVVSAVGGAAKVAAAGVMAQTQAWIAGKSPLDQIKIAEQSRQQTQAALRAGAKEQIFSLQNQLQVSQAVTGEEKIKATAAATYNQVLHDTNDAGLAAQAAAATEANMRAQVNSQAKATLLTMKDQLYVAQGATQADSIRRQGQVTYNQLVRDGVDSTLAQQVATTQVAAATAQASQAVNAQSAALERQTAMIYAQMNGTEAKVAAENAYQAAIEAGADSAAAARAAEAAHENIIAQKKMQRLQAQQQEIQRQQQINQMVEDKLYSMQKEIDLANAHTPAQKAQVRAAHEYDDAIRAGASSTQAAALQAKRLELEMAKAAEAAAEVARQTANARAAAAAAEVGMDLPSAGPGQYQSISVMPGVKEMVEREYGGFGNIEKGLPFIVPNAEGLKFAANKQGEEIFGKGNFTVDPREIRRSASFRYLYPEGGVDTGYWGGGIQLPGSVPTDEFFFSQLGAERFFANISKQGYSTTQSAFGSAEQMMKEFSFSLQNKEFQNNMERLIDLMSEEDKIKTYESEIAKLRSEPQTLARDELIKSLQDSLDQLKESVDKNTEAQLDPLFSQGHEFINQLKIGYYKAAGGLRGVVAGAGNSDTRRIMMDLTPGELVTVTPPDEIGNGAANDNSRNITQNITINIAGGDMPVDRLTARQRAQGFIKAATMAAS